MSSRPRRQSQGQGGYVLVSVLLATAVIFTAGMVVTRRVTTEIKLGRKSHEHTQAWYAAMAGIEDCLAYLNWDPAARSAVETAGLGVTLCERSLSDSGFQYDVRATMGNARQVLFTSTGRSGRSARTLSAVARRTLVDRDDKLHAWAGGTMKFSGSGSLEGNLYSDGNIEIGGTFTVCGNYYARNQTIRGSNVTNKAGCQVSFTSNYPMVAFPDMRVDALKARATVTYAGDHSPQCPSGSGSTRTPDCDGPVTGEKIVRVVGKLRMQPYTPSGSTSTSQVLRYTGRVVYVVEQGAEITINNVEVAPGGMLQLIIDGTGQTIRIWPNNQGVVTAHIVVPAGKLETPGTVNIRGLVFAREWDNSGSLNWRSDPLNGICTGTACLPVRMALIRFWES